MGAISRPGIYLTTLALILAGCSDSGAGDVVDTATSALATTEAPDPATSETTQPIASTTTGPATTTEPEPDVFRIAPAGPWPGPIILYGPGGISYRLHGDLFTNVVDGPVSVAVDTYLTGIVYQRPGDDRRAFIQGEDGDQELLVAGENQTIRLVGARIEPDDANTFHLLYIRRNSSTPEATTETLRSYNMETGEVTEIYQTGGWESGTDFDFIGGELAVGRWGGEGFFRTDIVNVVTGEIKQSFPAKGECFDGEGCLPFDVATLSGNTIYGFGERRNDAGIVDQRALYELNIETAELTELISFPWDNGAYYPVDIWMSDDLVVVSLSTTYGGYEGQPLPALIYDTQTSEVWTAPSSGYLHPGWLS